MPPATLAACEAWTETTTGSEDDFALPRRRAIWTLYPYGGVRLAELAWTIDTGLPRVEVEDANQLDAVRARQGQQAACHSAAGRGDRAVARLPPGGAGCRPIYPRTKCCR